MKIWMCVCLALFLACASTAVPPKQTSADAQELIDADLRFARDSSVRGADAWRDVWADDGVMPARDGMSTGGEAVRSQVAPSYASGMKIEWTPQSAQIAPAGDLGYTWGRWVRTTAEGKQSHGTYITVWEKRNGVWKVVYDNGTVDPR